MYNSIKINDKILDIIPSNISMSYDIVKSTDRALDGTLYADVEQKKQRIKVLFDIVSQAQFETIQQQFNIYTGVSVQYLNNIQAKCLVDNIAFEPWLVNGDLCWRNVVVDLLEM
jgi:hypothetical protein